MEQIDRCGTCGTTPENLGFHGDGQGDYREGERATFQCNYCGQRLYRHTAEEWNMTQRGLRFARVEHAAASIMGAGVSDHTAIYNARELIRLMESIRA